MQPALGVWYDKLSRLRAPQYLPSRIYASSYSFSTNAYAHAHLIDLDSDTYPQFRIQLIHERHSLPIGRTCTILEPL